MVSYHIHNSMSPLLGQIKGTLSTLHKGIEIGSDENLICLSGTMGHSGIPIEDGTSNVTVTGNYTIDPCTTPQTIRFILSIFKGGVLQIQTRRDVVFTVAGSFSQSVTFRPSAGGRPTYLEELAKLDHYSKAQYYPRKR